MMFPSKTLIEIYTKKFCYNTLFKRLVICEAGNVEVKVLSASIETLDLKTIFLFCFLFCFVLDNCTQLFQKILKNMVATKLVHNNIIYKKTRILCFIDGIHFSKFQFFR